VRLSHASSGNALAPWPTRIRSAAGCSGQGAPAPAGQSVEDRRRSNFFAESWAELRKVEWPGQAQVIQGTVVVLIACLVVGFYLYVNDAVWKQVVSKVLLGQ
jgi:preprotein translocase subunit SecE